MITLDAKKFKVIENSNGLSGKDTIFEYCQQQDALTGMYAGETVLNGQVVGKFIKKDYIKLLFQCITTHGELKAGISQGQITQLDDGKLKIDFEWRWSDEAIWHKSEHLEL